MKPPPPPFRPGGIGRRTFATLVDMVLFCLISVLLLLPLADAIEWQAALVDFDVLAGEVSDPELLSHGSGIFGLWTIAWWAYFIVGWGAVGASPGKWLAGLEVIDYRGHCPIGMSRAALRLLAYIISSLSLGLGHLVAVFRADRRTLHDLLAGTQVVRRGVPRRAAVGADSGSRDGRRPEPTDDADSEAIEKAETPPGD